MAVDDNYTVALLHCNGADAGTSFVDESGKAWTANGNAQIDTAQSKFGGASALFDGTGDYIDTPDHADFDVGSGDFTVDFWVRFNSVASVPMNLFGQSNAALGLTTISFFGSLGSDTKLYARMYSGSTLYSAGNNATILANTWYHYAAIRHGNNLYCAVDGVLSAATSVTGVTVNNSANKMAIGRLGEYASLYFNGWIDEFRISKGVARWTANFTPPTWEYLPKASFFQFM